MTFDPLHQTPDRMSRAARERSGDVIGTFRQARLWIHQIQILQVWQTPSQQIQTLEQVHHLRWKVMTFSRRDHGMWGGWRGHLRTRIHQAVFMGTGLTGVVWGGRLWTRDPVCDLWPFRLLREGRTVTLCWKWCKHRVLYSYLIVLVNVCDCRHSRATLNFHLLTFDLYYDDSVFESSCKCFFSLFLCHICSVKLIMN